MKIKFIKDYAINRGACPLNIGGFDMLETEIVKADTVVDLEKDNGDGAFSDELIKWIIDNGFAEKVKENYLFEDITHDDQGDKVAVDIWFSKDKGGSHPKKMVDFIQFMEAINVVSQDEGFMTRSENGSGWAICLKDDGRLGATVINNKVASAFCFEWNDDAEASIKKHPGEWRFIINYGWGKE